MPATGAVRVVVRDMAGEPVVGARVVVRPPRPRAFGHWPGTEAPTPVAGWRALPPSWDLAPRAEGVTGADGVVEVTGLAPGVWTAEVDAPGRVRRSVTRPVTAIADAHEAAREVTIVAEQGHPFDGRVLTDSGAPVADAFVIAQYPGIAADGRCDDARDDFAVERSDAEGRFRFDALPSTIVSIRCGVPAAWSSHEWSVLVPSVRSLDLRIVARGPVEGVVRGEPAGEPVAGADVVFSIETWHTARVTAHATTDAEGRYRIPLYPGEDVLDISVDAPGWWHVPRVVGARQPPFQLDEDRETVLDLVVTPDTPEHAAIRGVVRGPDGPVAGATVWLSAHDDSWMSATRTTDPQGRFWFIEAPPQLLTVGVEGAHGLYQPGTSRLGDASGGPPPDPTAPFWIAADAPRPADVDVVLAHGGRISGRVVDEAGKPVAGADVGARGGVRSTTGADGTFVLEGLDEPSQTRVWASRKDGNLEGENATVTAGAGADVEGVEVRVHAEPVAGTVVVVGRVRVADPEMSSRDAHIECRGVWVPLAASGEFRVEFEVRPSWDSVTVWAVAPGWGERRAEVAVSTEGGTADAGELVVQASGIEGTVTDATGPVAGAFVRIAPKREFTGIACGIGEDPEAPLAAVTGADGSFEIPGVADGVWTLHVAASGFIEEEQDASVQADGGTAQCSVELSRAASLHGRVLHPDGRPVADAQVEARREDGQRFGPWDGYATTDSDGGFDLRVRADANYTLEVSPGYDAEGFLATTSGPHAPPESPIEITIDDGRLIAGQVVDGDRLPVRGARVVCQTADDERDAVAESVTAADGAFVLTALPDGSYDISVACGLADAVVVRGVAAGRTDVEVRVPVPTTIEGLLVDEGGVPAARRRLVATPLAERADEDVHVEGATDDVGRFRLVGLGGTPCRVELMGGAGSSPMRSRWPLVGGAPVAPGSKDVTLRIATPAETAISGRFVDEAGQPFGGVSVQIPSRPNPLVQHSGELAGASFEQDGIPLGAPCGIVAVCAGFRWKFDVPVGTRDLVIVAGADGVHRVEFGGGGVTSAHLEMEIGDGIVRPASIEGVRLVHLGSGAIVPVSAAERHFIWGSRYEIPNLTIGPYRVEARGSARDEWHPCRPARGPRGDDLLVWDSETSDRR